MARIPTIGQEVALRAPGGQRLQSFDSGAADNLARGVSALAGGVAQVAKAKDDFQARVDEATANDLDAAFGQAAREIESPFLQAQGKNAVEAAKATLESWQETQSNFLARASNDRQRGMLKGVLDRRMERFQNQYNSHLTQETEKWQTSAEDSRLASVSVDVANAPVGSEERNQAFMALGGVLDGIAMRRGLDSETRKAMGFAAVSDIHVSTLQSLVGAGDAQKAKDYFTAHEEQIAPEKRPGVANAVRELDYDWRAEMLVNDSFNIDETPTIEVAPQGGTREVVRFQPPVSASVGSRFGARRSPGGVGSTDHKGVDFPVPPNTPVTASLPGVVRIKQDPDGYGNYVVVDHGNGLETRYAHLSRYNVRDGQSVGQGDVIALSGGQRGAAGAGNSQGAHLHFEVRRNGQPVDPSSVFNQNTEVAPGAGRPAAAGVIVTEQDVTDWAEKNSGGDWRFRRILEGRARQRLNGERAGRADAEGEAQRALEAYLPGGANEVADLSQIPASVRSAVSPSALRSAANQIEAEQKAKAGGETVKTDQEVYNDILTTRFLDPAAFAQQDLTALAPYLSPGDLRSLRTDQVQIRARPDTPENNPRRAALQTALPQIRRMAESAKIQVGPKASEEDQALFNGLLTYSRQEIEAFVDREDRLPTQEDVARIVGQGLQQREGARTGLFGLGGREQQYNFATIVPPAAQAQIIARYRAATGGDNPSADEIRQAYMLARRNGEFR
jgi:murein DD-endopeptidase MepM/ murein hydrolase activator NlpD